MLFSNQIKIKSNRTKGLRRQQVEQVVVDQLQSFPLSPVLEARRLVEANNYDPSWPLDPVRRNQLGLACCNLLLQPGMLDKIQTTISTIIYKAPQQQKPDLNTLANQSNQATAC